LAFGRFRVDRFDLRGFLIEEFDQLFSLALLVERDLVCVLLFLRGKAVLNGLTLAGVARQRNWR